MPVPSTAQVTPLDAPTSYPTTDQSTGMATPTHKQWMQRVFDFINTTNRVIPCNCTNVGNVYTLTLLNPQPLVTQYNDYDIYVAVASATSTGLVTAKVVTTARTFSTINVYKTNGSAQATTGDIVSGSLYFWIFNDALNSNAGGLVIK
jgi:hypothetical protein